MTREIKFRGKRIDNGEWVYGYLLEKYTKVDSIPRFAIDECWSFEDDEWTSLCVYEVNPATVGQFTGLKDKNGVKIYEGDIILWGDKTAREKGTEIHVFVEYKSGCFGIFNGENFHEFYHYMAGKWDDSEITDDMWGELPIEKYFRACFEVIGNIYDNPELLEVEHGK